MIFTVLYTFVLLACFNSWIRVLIEEFMFVQILMNSSIYLNTYMNILFSIIRYVKFVKSSSTIDDASNYNQHNWKKKDINIQNFFVCFKYF